MHSQTAAPKNDYHYLKLSTQSKHTYAIYITQFKNKNSLHNLCTPNTLMPPQFFTLIFYFPLLIKVGTKKTGADSPPIKQEAEEEFSSEGGLVTKKNRTGH